MTQEECEAPLRFNNTYEEYEVIAKILREKTSHRPVVAIICGSGLSGLGDLIQSKEIIPYEEIPYFPVSTVPGHIGRLIFGLLNDVPVVCMQGRFHFYEGWEMQKTTIPIRVFKLLGVHTLIVTNAAGGLNPDYAVGDLMVIKDHINFVGMAGASPLIGLNDSRWGLRFPPMNSAYDVDLRKVTHTLAQQLNLGAVHEGVYAMVAGPSFETIAEARAFRVLGADCMGMSTAPEVVVARHCGLRCLGISLITNLIVQDYDSKAQVDHTAVLEVGKRRAGDLQSLVGELVKNITHGTNL